MALGSCYTCIKYLMFAFNFIFWLLGCAILGVGIWLRVDENAVSLDSSYRQILYIMAYGLIAIGAIVMLVGFLGCCGAIRENRCMLATFFGCLFIIFAVFLGFGIWALVVNDTVKEKLEETLEAAVKGYYDDASQKDFMDTIQISLDCCGYTKMDLDYGYVKGIPESCRPDSKPCTTALHNWVGSKLVPVAGVAIGAAVVMILGMIFSMVLCCAIRDTVA